MKKIVLLLCSLLLLISCGEDDQEILPKSAVKSKYITKYKMVFGNSSNGSLSAEVELDTGLAIMSNRMLIKGTIKCHSWNNWNANHLLGHRIVFMINYPSAANPTEIGAYAIPTGSKPGDTDYDLKRSFVFYANIDIYDSLPVNATHSYKMDGYITIDGLTPTTASSKKNVTYSIYKKPRIATTFEEKDGSWYISGVWASGVKHDFGSVAIDANKTLEYHIENVGGNELSVGNISISGDSAFSIVAQPAVKDVWYNEAADKVKFFVKYQPTSEGENSAVLSIPSNDPETPLFKVNLSGKGYDKPSITISSHSVNAILKKNCTVSGVAADPSSGIQKVEWSLDNSTWKTATGTANWSFAIETRDYVDGNYTLYVRATDNIGITETKQIAVRFDNNAFPTAQLIKEADVNGDGKTDFVIIPSGNTVYTYLSQTDGTYKIVSFSPSADYQTVGTGVWKTGDFNSDGKIDLIHIVTVGSKDYMHPWLSNGNGTYAVLRYTPSVGYDNSSGEWRVGDFDGDGDTDLVHLVNSNYVHVHFCQGGGYFQVMAPFYPSGVNGGYQVIGSGKWLVGKFNSDTKDDLVHIVTVGTKDYMHPWYSEGNGTFAVHRYVPSVGYDTSNGDWLAGDFNADGMTDLVHLTGANYTHVHYSTGNNGQFQVTGRFNPPAGYALHNTGYWKTGDFNGDGKTDLVHIGTVNAADYVYTWLSQGDAAGSFNVVYYQHALYNTTHGVWGVGKINGDNRDDLMHIPDGRYCHPWNSDGNGNFSILKWFYE